MQLVNFDYSLKNIPISSNQSYLKSIFDKIESLIRRMRWKVHFYDSNNTENKNSPNFNFEFKSAVTPLQKEHFNAFDMVRCVEFRRSCNAFEK